MLSKKCICVANYIVKRTNDFNCGKKTEREKIFLSCKRLQKLLYFSETEYMKRHNGQSMFKDEFYAWPSGPVIPEVYDAFVQDLDGEMRPVEEGKYKLITEEMKEALDYIFDKTKEMDTIDIIKKSREKGGPWEKVYDDSDVNHQQIISKEKMYESYKNTDLSAMLR